MSELLKNIDVRTRLAGANKLEILLFTVKEMHFWAKEPLPREYEVLVEKQRQSDRQLRRATSLRSASKSLRIVDDTWPVYRACSMATIRGTSDALGSH